MPVSPSIPRDLRLLPFRGSDVVKNGLLTWTALRGRAWRRLLPDIYIAADVPLDHRMWCYAASLAVADRGAISGLSAAVMWGVDVISPDAVEVTIPSSLRRAETANLWVVRSVLPPSDIAVAGVRLTTPERTAFDIGRRLTLLDAVVAIDAMLAKRLVRLDALGTYCDEHRRWPGSAQLPLVLDRVEPLSR